MIFRDDQLLDLIDPSRLSDRQLLEKSVRILERIEARMTVDEDYLHATLNSLDVQITDLATRLQGWASQLADAIHTATDYQSLRETVNAVADKIQADAVTISQMAQPSAVVDPENPAQVTPIPSDPSQPIRAGA